MRKGKLDARRIPKSTLLGPCLQLHRRRSSKQLGGRIPGRGIEILGIPGLMAHRRTPRVDFWLCGRAECQGARR